MLELYFVSNLVLDDAWSGTTEHYLTRAGSESEAIEKVAATIDQDNKSMLSAELVSFDAAWEVATLSTCRIGD